MVHEGQIAYSIIEIHDTDTKAKSLNVFITLHSSSLFNAESNEYV